MDERKRIGDLMRQDTYRPAYGGPLAYDAGFGDIYPLRDRLRAQYGPMSGSYFDPVADMIESREGVRGIGTMVNPERFRDAVSRMPVSGNVVYADPVPFDERFRGF